MDTRHRVLISAILANESVIVQCYHVCSCLLQLGSSIVMGRIISVRHAGLDKVRTSCCRLQAGLKKIIFSDSVRVLVEAIHFDSINKYGFNTVHYCSVAVLIVLLHFVILVETLPVACNCGYICKPDISIFLPMHTFIFCVLALKIIAYFGG